MIVKPIDTQQSPMTTVAKPIGYSDPRTLPPDDINEERFAGQHQLLYPILRAASDVVPFASFAWPSGRQEFAEKSLGGKGLQLALDAAVFLPPAWIGKGLKVMSSPVVRGVQGVGKFAGTRLNLKLLSVEEAPKDVLTPIMRKLNEFVPKDPKTELAKLGFSSEEISSVIGKGNRFAGDGLLWQDAGRSGGLLKTYSPNTAKLFDTKTGIRKTDWVKKINEWAKPAAEQRLAHEKNLYNRYVKGALHASDRQAENIFKSQVNALFGKESVAQVTMKNISGEDMRKVLLDTLINKGKIFRRTDVSLRGWIDLPRKVAGKFEPLYGTLTLKNKIMEKIGLSNHLALNYIGKFHEILEGNGLGTFAKGGKFVEAFTRQEYKDAGMLIRKLDNLQQAGKSIDGVTTSYSLNTQRLVRSYQEWTDYVYSEYLAEEIPRIFRRVGINAEGENAVVSLMVPQGQKFGSYITEALAAGNNLDYKTKYMFLDNILRQIRAQTKKYGESWIEDATPEKLDSLLKALSFQGKGNKNGMMNYLENYGQRIFSGRGSRTLESLSEKETAPGFTMLRTEEEALEATDDLETLVVTRARQQSRYTMLKPHEMGIIEEINNLPKRLRDIFTHYYARLTGARSDTDRKVAQWINQRLGTEWTAERVTNLSYKLNDFVYLGGIGFKPFSALRNLFQVPLNVPADMGGIKNVYWLTRGLKKGYEPATREWIRKAGIITEYAPDILFRPQVSKYAAGRRFEHLRDFGMSLFRGSDLHNRYWTAGAAIEKWDYFFRKFYQNGKLDINKFTKKVGLSTREPWIRDDITKALREGTGESLERAKKAFVSDVVADTQYLYGPLEAPVIGQRFGSLSRTGVVFQSWWMNYASLLEKWFTRSGSVPEAADRLLTWMFASYVSYHVMSKMWGETTAAKTVGFGPLPTQLDVPAPWRPFVDMLGTVMTAASIPTGTKTFEDVERQMAKTLKSSMIFAPGGLQMVKSWPALKEGDREALVRSIVGLR